MQRIRGTESHGVRGTLYTVLRLFFSYFMTPVVAWTSYQLTLASLLPVYHIVICSLVLTLIPVAFWWSLRQATARQLGYFLVDARFKREDAASVPRAQDQFAFAIFVLMYLRGCAIGGLQMSGFLQLLALGACEIVQLVVAVFLRRATFMDTGVGLLCALRLVFLLLCIGFLPDVAGHVQRSVLGVVVLSLQMVILAAVFIGPSFLRIALMGMRMMRGETREKQVRWPGIPLDDDADCLVSRCLCFHHCLPQRLRLRGRHMCSIGSRRSVLRIESRLSASKMRCPPVTP